MYTKKYHCKSAYIFNFEIKSLPNYVFDRAI